ncbi:lanthionine synthetase LanC family protein [Streptomyces mirabilis]|uniref:lanthionine synthetase LanC family protein n=1 Tax=Streptomyces mirabilis TaxID=68239 RepID=UPI00367FFFAB
MLNYDAQLQNLARHVRVINGSAFRWFGRQVVATSAEPGESGVDIDPLRSLLARYLYTFFYITGTPVPAGARLRPGNGDLDHALVDAINAAVVGTGPREKDWTVVNSTDTGLVAQRAGISYLVPLADVDTTSLADTGQAAIQQPPCLRTAQEGFCFVLGDLPLPATSSAHARLYWNLFPDGAPVLTRALTREMNGRSIPFQLKLVNSEAAYTRCDAAVLFVPTDHVAAALDVVAGQRAGLAWTLKDSVPALTKRLAAGIGAAQDPGTGESFGQNRCRLLAEALCEPDVLAARGEQRRARAMALALEARGVSITAPYLRAGSADYLAFPKVRRSRHHSECRRVADVCKASPTPVQAAARIGNMLVDEALWSDHSCTWLVQRSIGQRIGTKADQRRMWVAASGDIYEGTAGIASFLADLAHLLDDGACGRTAAGALVHAARECERSMRPQDAAFHLGWTGVVYCLLRAGRRLNRPDLAEWGERIARDRLAQDLTCEGNDWIDGLAGAVTGLLALAREGLDAPVVEAADRLGRILLDRSVTTGDLRTWPGERRNHTPPLTGMAHGAAGIALALTELAAATGDGAYDTAASSTVAYERRRFSRTQLNWPDFRPTGFPGDGTPRGRRYAVAWCHGAPGIALARTRMWQVTGDDEVRAEAKAGLETTCRSLEWLVGDGSDRMVLCHGLSGNLAIIRQCEREGVAPPPQFGAATSAAVRHLCAMASLLEADGGVSRWMREMPALLTGAAGIGHALLLEDGAATPCLLASTAPTPARVNGHVALSPEAANSYGSAKISVKRVTKSSLR